MRNWGYGDADLSTGVHGGLTLTALALRDSESSGTSDASLVITADLGWWRTMEDEGQVRGAVLDATGLAADRVLLHLTHTHAGPSICREDADLLGGEPVPGYLDALAAAAADAAGRAIADLQRADLVWSAGTHGLAAVRDLTHDGQALLGFDPEQDPDQTLIVGRASRSDGTLLATIVNYACHPTTLGYDNSHLSPDYVGPMRDVVESHTGAPCVFLQGASGELGPRQQYSGELELADRHGASLGHAVLGVLLAMPAPGTDLELDDIIQSGAPLAIWDPVPASWDGTASRLHREVPVEVKALPPIEDLERDWADIDPRSRAERLRRATRLRRTYADMGKPVHPLWVWRFGDAVFVAHPGEAYSALQSTLRARFPDTTIVVMNLTNGPGWVYLPPEHAYHEDRYQAWQTVLQAGSLERLIAAADAAIVELGFTATAEVAS
ncbi:Neutral/alkaline non-lysosomal ceramidase, N-terminal [Plantibacter sp. RU18]